MESKSPTPTTTGRTRRTSRPKLSLLNPRNWNRPLAAGVLPAYDEALKFIAKDSRLLKKEVECLKTSIENLEKAPEKDEKALQAMKQKLGVLEVQSEVNLPDVRWKCANGMGA